MPLLLILLAVVLAGCNVEPRTYAPPPQRRPLSAVSWGLRMLVMTDDSVEARIVEDISRGHADAWRWTGRHPTLRVRVPAASGLKYRIEFAIADVTLKDTGPVTVTFEVNGQALGRKTYPQAGTQTWEAPVPPEMLHPDEDNTIGASVDKVWTSPQDGSRLGMILSAIGLVR